jgi:adenine phosphoribosyltransferase
VHTISEYIKSTIRTVPDWPIPGVMFRDITPLFQDPRTLRVLIDAFIHRYVDQKIDVVAGIDARGFLLGSTVAYQLNRGFIPVRKKGKLPYKTISEEYSLEYGTASIEINEDACSSGDRIVLFDDLIATGGTMLAALNLLQRLGASTIEVAAIIDLPELGGSKKIRDAGYPVFAICEFEGH